MSINSFLFSCVHERDNSFHMIDKKKVMGGRLSPSPPFPPEDAPGFEYRYQGLSKRGGGRTGLASWGAINLKAVSLYDLVSHVIFMIIRGAPLTRLSQGASEPLARPRTVYFNAPSTS